MFCQWNVFVFFSYFGKIFIKSKWYYWISDEILIYKWKIGSDGLVNLLNKAVDSRRGQLSIRMSSSDFRRTIKLKGECLVGKHLNIQPGLSACPRTRLENVCRFDWVCMLCSALDMECICTDWLVSNSNLNPYHWFTEYCTATMLY